MLDENEKFEKKEAMDYTPMPEDIYTVELFDVTSRQEETYASKKGKTEGKEYEAKLAFQFVVLDEDHRGRNLLDNFVHPFLYAGKNGKNSLWRIVEGLLARELDLKEEAEGIDGKCINALIGKQLRVGIIHKISGDKTYENIDKYLPAKEQLDSLTTDEKQEAGEFADMVKESRDKKKSNTPTKPENAPVSDNKEDEVDINSIPF